MERHHRRFIPNKVQSFLGGVAALGEGFVSFAGGFLPERSSRRNQSDPWQDTGNNLRHVTGQPSEAEIDAMKERLMQRVREVKQEQESKEE